MSEHRKPTPAEIFLKDQADAATRHAGEIVGGPPLPSGPVTRDMAAKFLTIWLLREAAGLPVLCEHLSHTSPSEAYAIPWAPDMARCIDCSMAELRKFDAKPPLFCHSCEEQIYLPEAPDIPPFYRATFSMPALTGMKNGKPHSLPAAVVTALICRACQEREGSWA